MDEKTKGQKGEITCLQAASELTEEQGLEHHSRATVGEFDSSGELRLKNGCRLGCIVSYLNTEKPQKVFMVEKGSMDSQEMTAWNTVVNN